MTRDYLIEITGTCNLRCPSCPTGNMLGKTSSPMPMGFMGEKLFKSILAKAASERDGLETNIYFYNWGEPLMHPKIAEYISYAKAYENFLVGLSSNLSLRKIDFGRILRASPDRLKISLSGYFPETYSKTHERGDINLVKANMYRLRHEMDRSKSKMHVAVSYHVYQDNASRDLENMERLCDELGFRLEPVWASFYPLEKVMPYCNGEDMDGDTEVIDMLAINPKELLVAAQKHRQAGCALQTDQTVVNFDGTVQLCCATYERSNIVSTDFCKTSASELKSIKDEHPTCHACIGGGFHAMMQYIGVEELESVANERIRKKNSVYELRQPNLYRRANESLSQKRA